MDNHLRVLIIEDSEDDAALLVRELRRGGYEPAHERVETADDLTAALDRQDWDIIIADYSMPRFNGITALKLVRARGLDVPFIFVSGTIGEDTAVEAMRNGANDYIMKGNMKRLMPAINRELREAGVRRGRMQAEKKIHRLAFYDSLTGLANRNMVYDHLRDSIYAGGSGPIALLLLDLDRFNEVNDTLGHARGDVLLRKVGSRINEAMGSACVTARLGGDEFAVVQRLASLSEAGQVGRKILKALESPFVIEDLPISVEASIGIAIYPEHGSTADVLLQRADVAMNTAKQTGSGLLVYDTGFDHHSHRRLALMGELRQAIEQDRLSVHYQPKIDLKTGRAIGVEALARWEHREYGHIPPDQFIIPAERTGLIKPLALWVFGKAHRQAMEWHREGRRITIAVNLSARNLIDPQLPERISELMRSDGLPPDRLEMEVTESAIMSDPVRALEAVKRLKSMGIGLAIDDFGTGYSSLAYLKTLPVDTIKVDKSFVMNMMKSQNDAVIVRSTIDMAHNLGLRVVAEGVENGDVLERLVSMGCDEAQGFYMCRPLPAEEIGRWLNESPWG